MSGSMSDNLSVWKYMVVMERAIMLLTSEYLVYLILFWIMYW